MFNPSKLDEERVAMIGRTMTAMPPGKKAAVGVNAGGEYEGKAAWYIEQFREKWPALNAESAVALTPGIDIITVHSPACSQN